MDQITFDNYSDNGDETNNSASDNDVTGADTANTPEGDRITLNDIDHMLNVDALDAFVDAEFRVEEWEKSLRTWRTNYGTTNETTAFPDGADDLVVELLTDAHPTTIRNNRQSRTHGVDIDEVDLDAGNGDVVTGGVLLALLNEDEQTEVVEKYHDAVKERKKADAMHDRFTVRRNKRWTEGKGDVGILKVTFDLEDAETGETYELILINRVDIGCSIVGKGSREYDLPDAAVEYIRDYSSLPTRFLISLNDAQPRTSREHGAPRHPRGLGGY